MVGTCPQGFQYIAEYFLTVIPDCIAQVLTPPVVENQAYVVNDPAAFYVVPDFGNSVESCPISYTASVD